MALPSALPAHPVNVRLPGSMDTRIGHIIGLQAPVGAPWLVYGREVESVSHGAFGAWYGAESWMKLVPQNGGKKRKKREKKRNDIEVSVAGGRCDDEYGPVIITLPFPVLTRHLLAPQSTNNHLTV